MFTFREAGTQVSLVTMSHPSPRATAPPHLPLFIKDPLKEEEGFYLLSWVFAFGFWPLALTLGFLVWEAFRREKICWKRIAKGKLLKGKDC
jgi:hypothetical protein